MSLPLSVLIVEDSEDDAELLVRELKRGGYDVTYERVDTADAMRAATHTKTWDLVICDYSMPHFSGMDALRLERAKSTEVPFIFLSGTIGEETAVTALKEGAQDYLMKSNLKRLIPAIQRELREAEERRERKRLEKQVQNLQKFEAIGRLAGGIAHDFNNALGVILGWAELGFSELPEGSPSRDKFKSIREQAERAAKWTAQLLAFSRHQVLRRQSIDLNNVPNGILKLLKSVIGEQIEFESKLQPDLPSVDADPAQLEQVLLNLCLNARDAMPNGGKILIETRSAEVTSEEARHINADAKPGKYVLLSVSDTGVGMAESTLDTIFEPFFTTKEVGRGTGLGLSVVQGIVQQHSGFVSVRSVLGEGSTFTVYLPMGTEAPEVVGPLDTERTLQRGSETLLLAEDHESLRELTCAALTARGYKVVLAGDGLEAIARFEEDPARFQLVILDVMMPRMNGTEVLARMRALRPDLPAIFTSGYALPIAALNRELARGTSFLQKPYKTEILGRQVRDTLDRKAVQ